MRESRKTIGWLDNNEDDRYWMDNNEDDRY